MESIRKAKKARKERLGVFQDNDLVMSIWTEHQKQQSEQALDPKRQDIENSFKDIKEVLEAIYVIDKTVSANKELFASTPG